MIFTPPPAEVRARGFQYEILWSLHANWIWYAALAVLFLLLGYWL